MLDCSIAYHKMIWYPAGLARDRAGGDRDHLVDGREGLAPLRERVGGVLEPLRRRQDLLLDKMTSLKQCVYT